MKTQKILIILSAICLIPMFFSCKSEQDTEKPVILLIKPAEGESLFVGKAIDFTIELKDNEGVASYKVDIHNNFDGHSHKHGDDGADFTFSKTWKLDGERNKHIHHHEIQIPEDATPGKYHLMVHCVDVNNNTSYISRNVVLVKDADHDDDHDHGDDDHGHGGHDHSHGH